MLVDEFDIEELGRGMFDLSDDADVFDYVFEEFDCDWSSFCQIIDKLLPLVIMGESPLTKKVYRGFGKDGMFFIKQEIINQ